MTSATGTRVRGLNRKWFEVGLGLFMVYQAMCLIWAWTLPGMAERILDSGFRLFILLLYPTINIVLGVALVVKITIRREVRRILREEYEVVNDD